MVGLNWRKWGSDFHLSFDSMASLASHKESAFFSLNHQQDLLFPIVYSSDFDYEYGFDLHIYFYAGIWLRRFYGDSYQVLASWLALSLKCRASFDFCSVREWEAWSEKAPALVFLILAPLWSKCWSLHSHRRYRDLHTRPEAPCHLWSMRHLPHFISGQLW